MSTFGHYFRVTTAGESRGKSLNRRRPGQSAITTPRNKKDRVTIHSGTEFGLGTPILLTVPNEDQRPKDYRNKSIDLYPRPSHANWTYLKKYGTISRVVAGAVAEKWLREIYGVEIIAFVTSVGNIKLFGDSDAMSADPTFLSLADTITRDKVDEFLPARCPDAEASKRMEARVAELRYQNDSTGGTVTYAPSGLGEPAFNKLEALIGHAMLSIPAVKGFEIGSSFLGAERNGSRDNDPFIPAPALDAAAHKTGIPRSRLHTKTNNLGGI
ncbi:chorismate synthase [Metarhizium guizhouense ARSEF 977]|uniref:chorismate synthase n=1 Tax=Metarhizium guizhouense (strain ARSEF 977) TaxID=1276136 RepID=A0A0B4GA23_METGA|nr:chorismate synthase [Metarhizium guizhouense ARSEF 977]